MGSLSEYGRTAGAAHSIGWHIVWCPKSRKRVLVGEAADRLKTLLCETAADRGWTVEALEVMPDHMHLIVRAGPDVSAALVVHQRKGFPSPVLCGEFPHLRARLPTLGSKPNFVASVGHVSEATVGRYIAEQTTRPIRAHGETGLQVPAAPDRETAGCADRLS
jgi:REP-associated tyrosine transposase